MAVSTDNGQTWTYSVVPDSTAKPVNAGTDPSVGIGAGNTVYFAYESGVGYTATVSGTNGNSTANATWSFTTST